MLKTIQHQQKQQVYYVSQKSNLSLVIFVFVLLKPFTYRDSHVPFTQAAKTSCHPFATPCKMF